jgi:hypothetical protein
VKLFKIDLQNVSSHLHKTRFYCISLSGWLFLSILVSFGFYEFGIYEYLSSVFYFSVLSDWLSKP